MKERILEFLKKENKTSSQFAEEIGVQPSSISHILSGRNKPSLDFITKMLLKYPLLNTDWLIFGKDPMYNVDDSVSDTLFSDDDKVDSLFGNTDEVIDIQNNVSDKSPQKTDLSTELGVSENTAKTGLTKVILLYSDNSFKEYTNF